MAPRYSVALGLTALMLVHHFGLWAWTSFRRGFPFLEAIDRSVILETVRTGSSGIGRGERILRV